MSGSEWTVISLGLCFLGLLGGWHLGGLLLLRQATYRLKSRPAWRVLVAFWGLALLHVSEIALGGLALAALGQWPGAGVLEGGYDGAAGFFYFSGITFATLGYAQADAHGPIRLFIMLQSLGGFMLITWSATFVFSIWDEHFRQSNR